MARSEKLLNHEACLLLVVDIQEAFAPHIQEMERLVQRTGILIEAAKLLQVPVLATEQYPKGLGRTVEPIRQALGLTPCHEKLCFSCLGEEEIRGAITLSGRRQVLLAGIETHVCIAQTALDLLALGLQPYVAADAVSSRRPLDHQIALHRLRQAGVTVTTSEAAILEMTAASRHPAFREISRLIK